MLKYWAILLILAIDNKNRADPPSYDPGDGENCRSVKDGRGEMFCKGGKHHDERERGG